MTDTTPDFDHFHRAEVPAWAASRNGALAATAASRLAPLTFELHDGRAYAFTATADGVTVQPGVADDGTVVRLSERAWSGFVTEKWTRYGLLYSGLVDVTRGDFSDLCLWEPALRALFHGRPVYDPAGLDLRDRRGNALGLATSFSLDEEPADLAHFLQTAGYLHVRGVFSTDEVDALRAEVERRAADARPDDLSSGHWTLDASGAPLIANLKYGAVGSAMLRGLHDDPRIRRILDFSGQPNLQPNVDRNEGTKIIFKRPGATHGLVDLPLHTDCGMGFHPIACQMVLIGVHLDAGTPASGQLHVAAGSHMVTTPDPAVTDTSSWPIVAIETAAGDCTVHYSHSLHAAPPPTGELPAGSHARRTAYLCFAPPSLFAALAPFEDLVNNEGGVVNSLPEDLITGDR